MWPVTASNCRLALAVAPVASVACALAEAVTSTLPLTVMSVLASTLARALAKAPLVPVCSAKAWTMMSPLTFTWPVTASICRLALARAELPVPLVFSARAFAVTSTLPPMSMLTLARMLAWALACASSVPEDWAKALTLMSWFTVTLPPMASICRLAQARAELGWIPTPFAEAETSTLPPTMISVLASMLTSAFALAVLVPEEWAMALAMMS